MSSIHAKNWLFLKRIARFGDTDAAGVMHFHQLLRWCHEAWEESLENYGVNTSDVFPAFAQEDCELLVALPIVHCEADFWAPIRTGDQLALELIPQRLDIGSFDVKTKFHLDGRYIAKGVLKHCAINIKTREKCSLPESIDRWLQASAPINSD